MCAHCDTVLSRLPAMIRGEHIAFDFVRLALAEIAVAHKLRTLKPRSRSSSVAHGLRSIAAACYRFIASPTSANYAVITAEFSAYARATLSANDARKANILNPEGKSESKGSPLFFTIPEDSFVHKPRRSNPAEIIQTAEFAQNQVRNRVKCAKHFQRVAQREDRSGNVKSAHLARAFASDFIGESKAIHSQLAEYIQVNL